jgi:hypothetical protein
VPADAADAAVAAVDARAVASFRVRAQQLHRVRGTIADTAVLDAGAQDTGPDGGAWALVLRGVAQDAVTVDSVACAWTVRGAPHLYRRADLAAVRAAVEPYSDADAGKRIHDASKPLRATGIGNLDAIDAIARQMRAIVAAPMAKGELSTRLTAAMPEPYLRTCRPCNAIHLYEMPFRLAALRAGLELRMGSSPPVLERMPDAGRREPDVDVDVDTARRLDLVRGYLRLLGPATPKLVAEYLDSPVRDVKERWPEDAVPVNLHGERRWILQDDLATLTEAGGGSVDEHECRLLGPFDLFLQARDRELLAPEPAHRAQLWPTLGRPGALLAGARLAGAWRAGAWRARRAGRGIAVAVTAWSPISPAAMTSVEEQAQRLADFRSTTLSSLTVDLP